jgi:hypothetical protein
LRFQKIFSKATIYTLQKKIEMLFFAKWVSQQQNKQSFKNLSNPTQFNRIQCPQTGSNHYSKICALAAFLFASPTKKPTGSQEDA